MRALLDQLREAGRPTMSGRVVSAVGLSIEIAGLDLGVGEAVRIVGDEGPIMAEVVALGDGRATCCLLYTSRCV